MELSQSFKQHRRLVVIICVVVAVLAAALAFLPRLLTNPQLTPTISSEEGVDPRSAFRLTGVSNLDEAGLRQQLKAQPETSFYLSQEEDKSWLLTPLHPLEAGAEYTITVLGKEFSFQVQKVLVVTSTFPTDGAQKVQTSSGIEFSFNSSALSTVDFQQALTIDPPLEGSISLGEDRFVFYPDKNMEYDTTYTVTLSPPLATPGGLELREPYSFTFTTQSIEEEKTAYLFQMGETLSYNCLSSETPLVSMHLDSSLDRSKLDVTIYQLDSAEEYRKELERVLPYRAYELPASGLVDTTQLTEYASFEGVPFSASEDESGGKGYYSSQFLLQFPEPLPEGYYVVEFSATGEDRAISSDPFTLTRQMYLQVSDLSVFQMASGSNLLLWVNDAATGEPVAEAKLEMTGQYTASAVTDTNGVASVSTGVIDEKGNRSYSLFTVTAGDRTFVDLARLNTYNTNDDTLTAHAYYSYLFTDRPIYQTTDTIKVWGMVRPRDTDGTVPETVILDLGNGAVTQEVETQDNGLFTAELSIQNFSTTASSYLSLKIQDDITLRELYLEIEDYVKPTYTASVAPEKPVYLLSDPAADPALVAEITFYDGTPASGFALQANTWQDNVSFPGGQDNLTTGEDGMVRIPMRFSEAEGTNTWYPRGYSITVSNTDAQGENFYFYPTIYVIHRDVMLRGKVTEQSADGVSVEVTTHQVDISSITDSDQLWEPENIQGAALNKEVSAAVHHVYYTKEKTGTRYDFISHTMVEDFKYVRHDEIIDNRSFTTTGGSYTLTGLPGCDEENYYYLTLSTTDSTGKAVQYEVGLGVQYYWNGSGNGNHQYGLEKVMEAGIQDQVETSSGTAFEENYTLRSRFGDGEDVTFQLVDNDQPVTQTGGRLLYTVVQDDFTHTTVTDATELQLPFDEELLPNYTITGAYFDGKHIYNLQDKGMRFDPQQRALELKLETDSQTYEPGGEMTVTATVTEKATGKPASQAEVVVSVVDEAIFALQGQSSNILGSIYESLSYPYIAKYASYTEKKYSDTTAGEKGGGGGGGEEFREDFQDTAQFFTGRTDDSGKLTFTFTLPDNITSWRLTGLALTDENYAGNVKENRAATKEFFLSPIVGSLYLEGDSITIGLRGAGTAVTTDSQAQYTVTVEGNGVNETLTASGGVRDYQSVSFPKLEAGDYTVSILGECEGRSDGVKLIFTVAETGIEVTRVQTFDLSQGLDVEPYRWPITIAFYDQSLAAYNEVLRQMDTYGARADQRLAAYFVAQQYQSEGCDWYDVGEMKEQLSDLTNWELLSLFPYSDADARLSTLAVMAMPDVVDSYLIYDLTPETVAASGQRASIGYLAQSLHHNVDLATLEGMLENPDGLDFVDQMYLATAIAQLGETETAAQWYEKLVSPKVTKLEGVSGSTALVVPGQDSLSDGDCTAAALLLATACGQEDADGLALGVTWKKSEYEPYIMERLYYLAKVKENSSAAGSASFTYTRDGEQVTQELGTQTERISFTRQQLEEAAFQVTSGKVWADVYYVAPASQDLDPANKKIPVTKKVEAVDGGTLEVGDLARITITPDLSAFDLDVGEAQLVIDDYIPTGMRFERYSAVDDSYSDQGWFLSSRQGQRLQFSAWGGNDADTQLKPIVYYARCMAPGDYVVESAYVTSTSGENWGASDREMVSIS